MTINKISSDISLTNKSLNEVYTKSLLDNLNPWEQISLEWDNGSFVFYKNDENRFWVRHNSAWIEFVNNPMAQNEMENVLNPIISHADTFEWKIPNDLLIRLKNIFWEKDKGNEWKRFTAEDLLKNVSLDNILSTLAFKKELLKKTERKLSEGIVGYLENATNILNELILQYPENSVIKNKIQEKFKYLESYKKTFSDWKFIGWVQKNISDLDSFLDILENQDSEWKLAKGIKNLRNRKNKDDSSAEINSFFNKIYAWDAFAIPYVQFSNNSFVWSLDQWTRAIGELNWWDKWSEKINKLWKEQELLMDEKFSFKQKENAFENANQEYVDSVWFLLGTWYNTLPNSKEYYEWIKNQIGIDKFISMPCSDIYPSVLQKIILPFYLKDLYNEACDLLWEKSLNKSLDKYVYELENPSWFAKIGAAFKKSEKKIESLKQISVKIKSLKKKFEDLEKQMNNFWNKKIDNLIIMASEFSIGKEFATVNNVNLYSPFTMPDQDKRLHFMRNN